MKKHILKSTGQEIQSADPKADCRHVVTQPNGKAGYDPDVYGYYFIPPEQRGHTGRFELIRHENVRKVER